MATIAFDTLKAKETLTRFGFPDEQATGVVTMTRDAFLENVATKEDIADLKTNQKADVADLKANQKADVAGLKADIARLETRLMKGLFVATSSIIATLLAIVVALGTIAVELSSVLFQN